MATYNGAEYIEEQVSTILPQLGPEDELVVVDDASRDDTVDRLRRFGDPRIEIHLNARNLGHVGTFARVLSLAKWPFICMADQDDRWLPERLAIMREAMASANALVVSGNQLVIDRVGRRIESPFVRLSSQDSARHLANIGRILSGRTGYFGCTMGLHVDLLPMILPIPEFVESHDLWIALAANLAKRNVHVEADILERRLHGENSSYSRRPLSAKLFSRWVHLRSIATLAARLDRLPAVTA